MKARTYVQLKIFSYKAACSFAALLGFGWIFFLCPCLCLLMYFTKGFYIPPAGVAALVAVIVLISLFFIAPPILAVRKSRKYCDALEQRGMMEHAASQLREQADWGASIVTNDYYFFMKTGQVICLRDLVRIELTTTLDRNDDGPDRERLDLHLTTRQGDSLHSCKHYSLRTPQEKRDLHWEFGILRDRYPDIAVETDAREKEEPEGSAAGAGLLIFLFLVICILVCCFSK